jgi:hypothetical protein
MKFFFKKHCAMISLSVFALSGCASLPRDQQGWTSQIQKDRVLVVGYSKPSKEDAPIHEQEKRVLQKLAQRLGARLQMREGNAHSLLGEAENRRLAIVMAQIPADSPFAEKLGFSQTFYTRQSDKTEYSIAVAPGENRLLLLLDQTIADEGKGESR